MIIFNMIITPLTIVLSRGWLAGTSFFLPRDTYDSNLKVMLDIQ